MGALLLQFLQNEKTQIESLLRHPALVHKEPLEERIQFISSGENRLGFTEEEIRATHYSLSDLLEIARDHRDIVQSLREGTVESAVLRHRAHFDRIRSLLGSRNPNGRDSPPT